MLWKVRSLFQGLPIVVFGFRALLEKRQSGRFGGRKVAELRLKYWRGRKRPRAVEGAGGAPRGLASWVVT